jgi:cytochrome c-type biogenesis protein CcmH
MRALVLALMLAATPAVAVLPDEVLDDPVLEQRARDLSRELRCIVCQSESIDDSNAAVARDLRILVRERLVAGDSDQEVLDFLVARYGEFVLLSPPVRGANWILYLAGPVLLIGGGLVAMTMFRRKQAALPDLTPEEARRLDALTRGGSRGP